MKKKIYKTPECQVFQLERSIGMDIPSESHTEFGTPKREDDEIIVIND